jgi:hypothetical protein
MHATSRNTLARCIEVYWIAVRQEWTHNGNRIATPALLRLWFVLEGPFAWAADSAIANALACAAQNSGFLLGLSIVALELGPSGPLRTVRAGFPAYGSSIGQRVRGRPRAASRTAPAVDENAGHLAGGGSRRTTMLVLPPCSRSRSKTVLQAAHRPA